MSRSPTLRWLSRLGLLWPVWAYFGSLLWTVRTYQGFGFGLVDLLLLGLVLLYLSLLLWVGESLRSRLALALSILAALGVGLEFFAQTRVRGPSHLSPWPPEFRRVSTAASTMPGIQGEIILSTNRYGLRGPDWPLSGADWRLLVVGGSTAACLYISDELSWPWRLGEQLSQARSERVFVGNAARDGDATWHHITLLREFPLADQFETVLFLVGINDMLIWLKNHEDKAKVRANQVLLHTENRDVAYKRLALFQLLERSLAGGKRLRDSEIIQTDRHGTWYGPRRQLYQTMLREGRTRDCRPDLEQGLEDYKSRLRTLIEICRSRNQTAIFLTQPTLYREDLESDLVKLLWMGYDPEGGFTHQVLGAVMARFNQALLEVCAEEQVLCLDLARALPKDTRTFYDDCHFNIDGCERIADFLTERLRGNG